MRAYVRKLIVSKYVAESINNKLQNVLAMKAFITCVQNFCMQVTKAFVAKTSFN